MLVSAVALIAATMGVIVRDPGLGEVGAKVLVRRDESGYGESEIKTSCCFVDVGPSRSKLVFCYWPALRVVSFSLPRSFL